MNMKGITGALTMACVVATAAAADDTLRVSVNGTPVRFEGTGPQMVGGRVLVPLRGVFEQMGADVEWDASTQSILAVGGGRQVRLRIGSPDATVNDRAVTLDVAPQLMQGSTMVPLRFLSESLGASVDWEPTDNLVAINTRTRSVGSAEHFTPPPHRYAPAPVVNSLTITRDTVLPLRLDQDLSSNGNRPGDHFTASVRGDASRYMGFPDGTVVEGTVREALPARGDHGGTLDIRFTQLRFPDGHRYRISGFVTRLEDNNIVRTGDGRYAARAGFNDSVGRDAEVGAGAGLLLGSFRGKAVGGAVVGGSIGALVGIFDNHLAHNITLRGGMRLALVLNRDIVIDGADLQ